MKSIIRTTLIALAVFSATLYSHAASTEADLRPIFNGRDFSGWIVPSPNLNWHIQNGVLVGSSEEKLRGSYLRTKKEYGDFVLELDIRCHGDEIDTGVDLRRPNFQLQIGVSRSLHRDMTGSWLTDGKGDPTRYPESGRAKDWQKYFKPNDWNTFRIEARGTTFTAWINGHQVSQYSSPRYAQPGPIGLQFHDGLAMKLEFRNLRLAEL
jgi:hypothetical protein